MPPLGVKPKYVHEAYRMRELQEAICRFIEANWPVPLEIVEEYNEISSKLPLEDEPQAQIESKKDEASSE